MQTWFGVSRAQAARSRFPAYRVEAGVRSVGAGVKAINSLDPRWSVALNVGVPRLLGDATDSPVT